jgi:hypothetical protein
MSKLFIANLTKQHQHFLYSVPEGDGDDRTYQSMQEYIDIGSQVQLPDTLTQAQLDIIVQHHSRYGMKPYDEARKIRDFTGLCYRFEEPVPMNDQGFIDDIVKSNNHTLDERNDKRRELTTVAINDRLRREASGSRAPLRRVEVEQVEETDGTPRVASGVEVPADGVAPRNATRPR